MMTNLSDFVIGYTAAAGYLRCSPQHIANLVAAGRLIPLDVSCSGVRVRGQLVRYAFRKSDLDSYLLSVRRYHESRLSRFVG